ncbi:Gp19/Gp15/Gp42 family protein [Actinomyces sp. MRS3W]|uniref:Gp19/Gp15/Gp42 family protein n=1 Tax=Actinomyces sp. MRS3W TaxID=2800796 RepID=UPI0028FD205E|nr:Gp19/Gp15/Gp42 family protein [Actinomyces sp. MRS3W]MDU0349236.1 Gp19/Gp15/Gp42 family protein [Actinomyces sp. MRS3W]
MADDTTPATFATPADLAARWRPLTDTEQARAQVLLEDATDMIKTEFPRWNEASEATLRRVTVAVVKRAMIAGQGTGADALGPVSAQSTTVGPFSESFTYANPTGDMYLTKAERRALRGGAGAFEIDLLAGGPP